MSEEFESINSRLPDLSAALAQRIAARQAEMNGTTLPPTGIIDPYQALLQKKKSTELGEVAPINVIKWPEADVKKLQDYCTKMGIVGFNSGRMPPLAALAHLKKQFGDDYTDVPLENRVPEGYEKKGTLSGYGPNYPYTEAMRRKQILHG